MSKTIDWTELAKRGVTTVVHYGSPDLYYGFVEVAPATAVLLDDQWQDAEVIVVRPKGKVPSKDDALNAIDQNVATKPSA